MTPDKDKSTKPTKEERRKVKLTAAQKAKIKALLKKTTSGKATTIDSASIADVEELIALVCDVHAVDRKAQYEPAAT